MSSISVRYPPIGSLSSSLRAIPQWYQLAAFASIAIPFAFNDSPALLRVVRQLHFSFGTHFVWPETYHAKLESMALHERLGFALYSALVAAVLLLLYLVRSSAMQRTNTIEVGGLAHAEGCGDATWREETPAPPTESGDICFLMQHRKHFAWYFPGWPHFERAVFVASLAEGAVSLRELLLSVSFTSDGIVSASASSTANSLLQRWIDAVVINYHVGVQLQLLALLMWHIVIDVLAPAAVALAYRLACDRAHRRVCALRWHLVTFAVARVVVRVAMEGGAALGAHQFASVVPLTAVRACALVSWMLLVVGLVNYAFGPEQRCGGVAGAKLWDTVQSALLSTLRCLILPSVALLAVLAVMVGVHVVELLLLWVAVVLLAVWIPAALDSFSSEFFALLSIGVALLAVHLELTATTDAAIYLGLVTFTALCATSAVYVTIAFATRRRHVAVAATTAPLVACTFDSFPEIAAALSLERWALMSSASHHSPLFGLARCMTRFHGHFRWLLPAGLLGVTLIATAINTAIASRRTHVAMRRFSPRGSRVVLTLSTFVRKMMHTAVTLALLLLSGAAAALSVEFGMPSSSLLVVRIIVAGIAFLVSLGVLMDLRDPLLLCVLRAAGFTVAEAVEDLKGGSAFSPPRVAMPAVQGPSEPHTEVYGSGEETVSQQ